MRGKKFRVTLSSPGANLAVTALLGGLDAEQTATVRFVVPPFMGMPTELPTVPQGFYEIEFDEVHILDEFVAAQQGDAALILAATSVS